MHRERERYFKSREVNVYKGVRTSFKLMDDTHCTKILQIVRFSRGYKAVDVHASLNEFMTILFGIPWS